MSASSEPQDAHELLLDLLNDVSELLEAEHKRTGSVAGAHRFGCRALSLDVYKLWTVRISTVIFTARQASFVGSLKCGMEKCGMTSCGVRVYLICIARQLAEVQGRPGAYRCHHSAGVGTYNG